MSRLGARSPAITFSLSVLFVKGSRRRRDQKQHPARCCAIKERVASRSKAKPSPHASYMVNVGSTRTCFNQNIVATCPKYMCKSKKHG